MIYNVCNRDFLRNFCCLLKTFFHFTRTASINNSETLCQSFEGSNFLHFSFFSLFLLFLTDVQRDFELPKKSKTDSANYSEEGIRSRKLSPEAIFSPHYVAGSLKRNVGPQVVKQWRDWFMREKFHVKFKESNWKMFPLRLSGAAAKIMAFLEFKFTFDISSF